MEIKCPYCGAEDDNCHSDLWEIEGDDNEIECSSCEKTIIVSAEVSVSYDAKRADCANDEHEYKEWNKYDYDKENFTIWFRDCLNCEHSDTHKVGYKEGLPDGVKNDH